MHYKRLYHVFLLGVFLLHYYAQSSLIYLNRWHDAIDMLVANYLGYSIPCGILGVAQLVLAQACFIKIWDAQ